METDETLETKVDNTENGIDGERDTTEKMATDMIKDTENTKTSAELVVKIVEKGEGNIAVTKDGMKKMKNVRVSPVIDCKAWTDEADRVVLEEVEKLEDRISSTSLPIEHTRQMPPARDVALDDLHHKPYFASSQAKRLKKDVKITDFKMAPATDVALNYQHKPVDPYFGSSQTKRSDKLFLEDVNGIETGGNVLSHRNGNVWEKAVVIEIMGQDKDASERKYRVKFHDDKKWSKLSTSRQTAFSDSINKPVTVGTRILAMCKDDETDEALCAGMVAEVPNGSNELRYLVFFDDGYANYCSSSKEIHKVFYQSKNVWDDIHPDQQDFVKDYLSQYPERPMLRLHKGQKVKTEWKGRWWVARVEEVDASLVRMFFPADKRSEWIYRGSTRLEPLYTALANDVANRNAGKIKKHNQTMSGSKKPIVEYTGNKSSPDKADKKKAVAKKSTTLITYKRTASTINSSGDTNNNNSRSSSSSTISMNSKGSKYMASDIQERLTATEDTGTIAVVSASEGHYAMMNQPQEVEGTVEVKTSKKKSSKVPIQQNKEKTPEQQQIVLLRFKQKLAITYPGVHALDDATLLCTCATKVKLGRARMLHNYTNFHLKRCQNPPITARHESHFPNSLMPSSIPSMYMGSSGEINIPTPRVLRSSQRK